MDIPSTEKISAELLEIEGQQRTLAILQLLSTRWRSVYRATWIGCLATLFIALLIPNRYSAMTRLMPPENQSSSALALLSQLGGTGASGLGQVLRVKNTGALFVAVLRSRTVTDRVVARFDLKKVYGTRLSRDARNALAANTAIAEDSKSGVIEITVTDKYPRRAAAIANAYVEELDRVMAELTTSAAHRERIFIEERLKTVKQDLDAAAENFSRFASKNAAIDVQEQGRAMVDAAARLQGELIAAESEMKGLQQIYTDSNVRVRALKARVAELQAQLEKLGGKDALGESGSAQGGQSIYPSIRQLPLLGVTYADLYRRTKIQEAVYEALTKQYELAKVEEAKEIPTVRVLDAAEVPERKTSPHRLLIVLFGTAFSFALGVIYVLGVARWEEIPPEDTRKFLAQYVLTGVKTKFHWQPADRMGLRAMPSWLWNRLRRRPLSAAEEPSEK